MNVATPVLVLIGGAVLALVLVPLWSMGSCFRFFAGATTFLIGAFGLGGGHAAAQSPGQRAQQSAGRRARAARPRDAGRTVIDPARPRPRRAMSRRMPRCLRAERRADTGRAAAEDDFRASTVSGRWTARGSRWPVCAPTHNWPRMTPAAIAAAISWTPVRVEQAGIIAQAAALAQ
ncbi:MAG: hypothetical protein R2838_21475 [Caldilineaceae bacterium]